jgi:hypothetical protein
MEEVARRYGISIRMMPYLIEDGIVPAYKIGLAVRINPVESDVAMRIFRKASKFDDIIDEELRGSAERAENIVKTATKRKKTVSGISAAS